MSVTSYENLTLDWVPESRLSRRFNIIAASVLTLVLLIGFILSSIDVPVRERAERTVVPDRIAKFILEKEKKQPPKPKPEVKPKPKELPKKPVIKKVQKKIDKPLTKTQEKAREKVKDTGLLALGNELADLIDTTDVAAVMGGKIRKDTGAAAASTNKSLLMAGASSGSGGVSSETYTTGVSQTKLSERELKLVKQSLGSTQNPEAKTSRSSSGNGSNVRPEEDITIVFDQNKGKLYSLYNRARRTNPGLKGKIILEISIASDGSVTKVTVVSSELNDVKLERQLVSRVKQFKFQSTGVDPIVVTYPIEFLPS